MAEHVHRVAPCVRGWWFDSVPPSLNTPPTWRCFHLCYTVFTYSHPARVPDGLGALGVAFFVFRQQNLSAKYVLAVGGGGAKKTHGPAGVA